MRNFSPDKEDGNIPIRKKRIYFLDKHTGQIESDEIRNIAYSEHFFNKKEDRKLQFLETRASDIIRHIIKEESLDYIVNDKKKMTHLCEYVFLQFVRTTTMRRDLRTIFETAVSKELSDEIKTILPIVIVDLLENISTDESFMKKIHGNLIDVDLLKGLINGFMFTNMPFLVFNDTPTPFLTNDDPITEGDYREGFYPAIMDECNYSLVFTIAPTLAIVFLKKSDVKRKPILTNFKVKMVMTEPIIKKLNKSLIEKANRYVFSNNKSNFFPLN